MRLKLLQSNLTRLIVIIFLLLFVQSTNALIMGNRADCTYSENSITDNCFSRSSEIPLRVLIIEGAANYLKLQSIFKEFLYKIELSELHGVDYNELSGILDSAIVHLDKARFNYFIFVERAENTQYQDWFIERLNSFEYEFFQKEKFLIKDIFDSVSYYLSRGDVTGVFYQILFDLDGISNLIRTLKISVEMKQFPNYDTLWHANQLLSKTQLFGQYASEVFYRITGDSKQSCE